MEVIVISSVQGFLNVLPRFRETSLICRNPMIHHIGFDIEYISKNERIRYGITGSVLDQKINPQNEVAICVIQMCNPTLCLILHVSNFCLIPSSLKEIIASHTWIKTGCGVYADLVKCMYNFGIIGVPAYYDISTLASCRGVRTPNLEFLISEYLGQPYTKNSDSVKDWTADLTDEMAHYCFEDAFYSYALARSIFGNADKIRINEFTVTFDHTPENYINRLQEYTQALQIPTQKYEIELKNSVYSVKCTVGNISVSGTNIIKMEIKQLLSLEMIIIINNRLREGLEL